MKVNVVGTREQNGTGKDGSKYSYVELHTIFKNGRVLGQAVEIIKVYSNSGFESIARQIKAGMDIDVDRDSRGYLVGLDICK